MANSKTHTAIEQLNIDICQFEEAILESEDYSDTQSLIAERDELLLELSDLEQPNDLDVLQDLVA